MSFVRHPGFAVRWLAVLILALAVDGCACQDLSPPSGAAPPLLGEAWRVPLVLRPASVAVDMQAPTRVGHTPGLAGEAFWLSVTALMTFGGPLLDLPDVLARHQTKVLDLPPACADSWVQVMNRPPWLGSAETRTSALQFLAEAMRLDLGRRGRALTVELETTPADDPRAPEALVQVGQRLAVPALAVADVRFRIEPQPKQCSMLMRVSVQMHLAQLGADPKSPEAVSMTRAAAVSVTAWATDPEVGTRALQDLVAQMGRAIVSTLPASSTP